MELGFNLSCQRIPPSFRQQDKKSPGQPLRQRKGSRTAAPLLLTTHPLLRPTTPEPVSRPGPVLSLADAGRPAFWLVDWPIGDKPVRVTSDGFPTAPGATHASYIGAPQSSSSMSTSKSPAFKATKTLWLTSDLDSETSIKHHRLPWLHLFTIPAAQWLRVAVNVGGNRFQPNWLAMKTWQSLTSSSSQSLVLSLDGSLLVQKWHSAKK